jgi:glycosyltransferase involved in cell wall biosynthesis
VSAAAESPEAPAVSVIVPVLDGAATIAATLHALGRQAAAPPHEVIVVDCGSTDGTRAILAAATGVTVVDCPERDPVSARNLGAARAAAPALAFTDADCVPEPGWLAAGLLALRGAELVQGRVLPARPPARHERTVSVGAEGGLYETANLFVRAGTFRTAGGFCRVPGVPLRPGQHFGEDVAFAWRARRAGARTAFAPAAVVRHAVFPRGPAGHLAERLRARHFPALVREVPELRAAFLTLGGFLSADAAWFDLALTGGLTAARSGRRRYALLALPYALGLIRRRGNPAVEVAADAVRAAALLAGSVASRTLVL